MVDLAVWAREDDRAQCPFELLHLRVHLYPVLYLAQLPGSVRARVPMCLVVYMNLIPSRCRNHARFRGPSKQYAPSLL